MTATISTPEASREILFPAELRPLSMGVLIGGEAVLAKSLSRCPGVFVIELEGAAGVQRRYYTASTSDGQVVLSDVSDEVARQLVNRAQQRVTVEGQAVAEQARRVGTGRAEEARKQHATVADEVSDRAGVTRGRALSKAEAMVAEGKLSIRHGNAARDLATDVALMHGARDRGEPNDTPSNPMSGVCWEDFMVEAGERFAAVRAAVQALPLFEGVSPWTVVEAVVVREVGLTTVAGSNSRSVLRRHLIALRFGLDVVGDAYRHPSDVAASQVLTQGIPSTLQYIADPDGTWRGITLNSTRWLAAERAQSVEKSAWALNNAARRYLLDLITEALGPGRHQVQAVAGVLDAHRRAAISRRMAAAAADGQREEQEAKEIAEEKRRVLARSGIR